MRKQRRSHRNHTLQGIPTNEREEKDSDREVANGGTGAVARPIEVGVVAVLNKNGHPFQQNRTFDQSDNPQI